MFSLLILMMSNLSNYSSWRLSIFRTARKIQSSGLIAAFIHRLYLNINKEVSYAESQSCTTKVAFPLNAPPETSALSSVGVSIEHIVSVSSGAKIFRTGTLSSMSERNWESLITFCQILTYNRILTSNMLH